MFTGIVETTGIVAHRTGDTLRLRPRVSLLGLSMGESIAVDGVCLTVDRLEGKELQFRLLPETLRATTLGSLKANGSVNLERSLRVGGRIGGHLLLGHVDCRGKVVSRKRTSASITLEISLPVPWAALLVPKGPVAVNGVSLTLDSKIGRDRFWVHLVPHTLSATALARKKPGEAVNLELDPVAKYLRGML